MTRVKQISNKAQGKQPPVDKDAGEAGANDQKKRRFKSATNALRAIRKEQVNTSMLLKKSPFNERVRVVAARLNGGVPLKWTNNALLSLLDTSQQYLIDRFMVANEMRVHRQKMTLTAGDMRLARKHAKGLAIDRPKALVLPTGA